MRYLTFGDSEQDSYEIAFLVPRLDEDQIRKHYIKPFGIRESMVIAFDLLQTKKKTPVTDQKEYLKELLPILKELNVKYLMVCDADYFKTIVREGKAESWLGYVKKADSDVSRSLGYHPKAIYCPNFAQVFYDPAKVSSKINQSFEALRRDVEGSYQNPGQGIIHFAAYPKTTKDIQVWLQRLLDMDVDLTCDLEGFSLKHYDAGIGTAAFAWNKHEGIAFPVDYQVLPEKNEEGEYGRFQLNGPVRELLKQFFKVFKRKITFHNISYDAMVLIYQLYMEDILDTAGLLNGMSIMLKNWDDTKLITYLATNSCAGNKLGLKDQAQEFAGNYAVEEIKDIRRIPLDELLQYNLVDALSTWYVHEKYYQKMVDDEQLEIYETIFKPAILDVVQMQLTGLPINREEVQKARELLQADQDDSVSRMRSLPLVADYEAYRLKTYTAEKNAEWKVKRMTEQEMLEASKTSETILKEITFNPNSGPQLQHLIYVQLGLPVIDYTDTKQPATGKDTLKKLKNHTQDKDVLQFLDALMDYTDVSIILSIFIPAFERSVQGPDGWHYLFGNFNLGGTISGRLSSNDPNLQNIPATGSKYAKIIKKCVQAPAGWLLVGLDFNSLEDMISALTTKDPNKLKVYTDGYDGHCLRAFAYFGEQMVGIDPNSVASINSIEKLYKPLRQESKAPTFALTYQGTYITLMNNCGFSKEKAQMIETRYHIMYEVSDKWVQDRLQEASKTGYVTAAFGLRVRTPLLKQVILGTRKTPFEAAAEGRTAGNALGQSWCLLNTRAGSEFMAKTRLSEFRLDIRPCAQIHDAQYYLMRDDLRTFMYLNEHLVAAAKWQDHPDIYHDEVKLGGDAFICYPNWAHEMTVENGADEQEIRDTISEHVAKLKEKGIL